MWRVSAILLVLVGLVAAAFGAVLVAILVYSEGHVHAPRFGRGSANYYIALGVIACFGFAFGCFRAAYREVTETEFHDLTYKPRAQLPDNDKYAAWVAKRNSRE
jgi:hypothetical protein